MERGFGCKEIQNDEFQESEMWETMEETEVLDEPRKARRSCVGPVYRQLPSAAAMLIPWAAKKGPELARHSAPVNIPDWPKIYGKSSMSSSCSYGDDGGGDDDEDEMDGRKVVPPHEWLARKEVSSMSVCEGAGRTLKGRDLRRVRHAVLTKTGFI